MKIDDQQIIILVFILSVISLIVSVYTFSLYKWKRYMKKLFANTINDYVKLQQESDYMKALHARTIHDYIELNNRLTDLQKKNK